MSLSDESQACLQLIRAHSAGVLRCGELPEPIRFVFSRTDHAVVFPLERYLLEELEFLLCLPDDSFDQSVRVLLEVSSLGSEREIDRDRHMAYHGPTTTGVWAQGKIDHAHTASGNVVDGDFLTNASPLKEAEPRLCKQLNSDIDALRSAANLLSGVSIPNPLAVGVDPHGFDVRARLGIVRVEFPSVCENAETASSVINALLDQPNHG